MSTLCEDENTLKSVRGNNTMRAGAVISRICETGVPLGYTGGLLLSYRNKNLAKKKTKSRHQWDICALFLLHKEAEAQSGPGFTFFFHMFSALTARLVERSKSINERKLSVSHLATAWQTSQRVLLTAPPACQICFFFKLHLLQWSSSGCRS